MPEIGLSGLLLDSPFSGSAVYTRNLCRWLPQVAPDLSYRLFVRDARPDDLPIPIQPLAGPLARFNTAAGTGARLDKLAWETVMLPLAARRFGEALIHSLYFAAPLVKPLPTVVTIHDLIPLTMAGYHRGRASLIYARLMAQSVKTATAVITVSEHARREILSVLGLPEERVHVAPEAADERFHPGHDPAEAEHLRAKYALPNEFFLYIGGAEKRKNLEFLVRTWAGVAQRLSDRGVHLVIATRFPPPDALYPDIPGLVRDLGMNRCIHLIGSVHEIDKPALYRRALGFCFPSRHEGFGLTPLEAMASGLPVLCSNAASLPEVVGGGGLLFDPDDTHAWQEGLLQVTDNTAMRDGLAQRALQRAALFSWRTTAEMTASIYRQVLAA